MDTVVLYDMLYAIHPIPILSQCKLHQVKIPTKMPPNFSFYLGYNCDILTKSSKSSKTSFPSIPFTDAYEEPRPSSSRSPKTVDTPKKTPPIQV
ncbi:hypothetical protein EYC84_004508 [Monilinia fructicola]|uniref:Uncharacterized protein n=1 Tax=Monilinia fructicola TaxID=38448 RepID=A0A5M9K5A4_MONFR|nr:hypothetical protein EYC84_004508 [Monilinia fructicola]